MLMSLRVHLPGFSMLSGRILAVLLLAVSAMPLSAQDPAATAALPEVGVVTLRERDLVLAERLPGRTSAFRLAEVRPQVTGILTQRLFAEGAMVEQGQALYQIDPALYDVAVASAEAALQTAVANAETVRLREARYARLIASNALSQQEYDDTRAALAQAEAAVLTAQAALRGARINLDYTRVYAPISGQISESLMTEGALVTANQAQALAVITQLDPIFVDLVQSSTAHLALRPRLMQMSTTPVTLELDESGLYEHEGALQFSSVFVSESTGSVQLRVLFPNPEQQLLPGLFVHANLQLGSEPALLVPQQSTQRDSNGGVSVWRLDANNALERVSITVGRAIGDQWQVLSGLAAGDRVVFDSFHRLAPGASVLPSPVNQAP
jgi:membrane fusion protein (multidrug efflux system)